MKLRSWRSDWTIIQLVIVYVSRKSFEQLLQITTIWFADFNPQSKLLPTKFSHKELVILKMSNVIFRFSFVLCWLNSSWFNFRGEHFDTGVKIRLLLSSNIIKLLYIIIFYYNTLFIILYYYTLKCIQYPFTHFPPFSVEYYHGKFNLLG